MEIMVRIDVQQGTENWKKLRMSMITCTDLSSLINMNPFRSKKALFNQKIGLEEVIVNDAMRRGSENESEALRALNEELGLSLAPAVIISNEHPHLLASLDGFDDKVIAEIKCGERSFRQAKQGIITPWYSCQINGQMLVCNLDWAYYYCWYKNESVLIKVERDEELIQRMLRASQEFYDDLINLRAPKDDYEDVHSIPDEEWNKRLEKTWKEALHDAKRTED